MHQFLAFEVADRRFALPAGALHEVVRAVAIAPLPKAPPIVEGVINVRGSVVPVLDIRQRLSLPASPVSPQQHFLLVQAGSRVVALRVDRAVELVTVQEGAVAAAAQVAPGAEFLAGVATLPDGVLVIHDLERFLSLDEAVGVDAALAGAAATGDAPVRRARGR